MKNKFSILLAAFSCFSLLSYGQAIKWSEGKDWKLYQVRTKASFTYPPDTLKQFESIPLDSTSMRHFLTSSIMWPAEKYANWMALYNITCELRGKTHKLVFSNYGGFFYDIVAKRYYNIPEDKRDEWNEFLILNYNRFESRMQK